MRISSNQNADFSILKSQFKTVPTTQGLLKVRILNSRGNQAQLQFEGRTLTATIDNQSLDGLEKGDTIFARILSDKDNTLILQKVESQPGFESLKTNDIASLLNRYGFKANPINMMKARLLVACKMAITEDTLKTMNRAIKSAGLKENLSSITAAAIHLGYVSSEDKQNLSETLRQFEDTKAPDSFLRSLASDLFSIYSGSVEQPNKGASSTIQSINQFINTFLVDMHAIMNGKANSPKENRPNDLGGRIAKVLANMVSLGSIDRNGSPNPEILKDLDFKETLGDGFMKSLLFQKDFNSRNQRSAPFYYYSIPIKFDRNFSNLDIFYFQSGAKNGDSSESVKNRHFMFRVSDPDLGIMLFDVNLANQDLELEIEADRKETGLLFKKNLHRLRSSLSQAGYSIEKASVRNCEIDILDKIGQSIDKPLDKLDINI